MKNENEDIERFKKEKLEAEEKWKNMKSMMFDYDGNGKNAMMDGEGSAEKLPRLMMVMKMKKIGNKILDFLDNKSVNQLKQVNRFLRWTISLNHKRVLSPYIQKIEEQNKVIENFESVHSKPKLLSNSLRAFPKFNSNGQRRLPLVPDLKNIQKAEEARQLHPQAVSQIAEALRSNQRGLSRDIQTRRK